MKRENVIVWIGIIWLEVRSLTEVESSLLLSESSLLDSKLNRFNPVHILTHSFFMIHFNIIISSMNQFPKRSPSFMFSVQQFVCISPFFMRSTFFRN